MIKITTGQRAVIFFIFGSLLIWGIVDSNFLNNCKRVSFIHTRSYVHFPYVIRPPLLPVSSILRLPSRDSSHTHYFFFLSLPFTSSFRPLDVRVVQSTHCVSACISMFELSVRWYVVDSSIAVSRTFVHTHSNPSKLQVSLNSNLTWLQIQQTLSRTQNHGRLLPPFLSSLSRLISSSVHRFSRQGGHSRGMIQDRHHHNRHFFPSERK